MKAMIVLSMILGCGCEFYLDVDADLNVGDIEKLADEIKESAEQTCDNACDKMAEHECAGAGVNCVADCEEIEFDGMLACIVDSGSCDDVLGCVDQKVEAE